MPRYARKKSGTGVYHVILRGINRQNLFKDELDCRKFLDTLERYKNGSRCKIYGYCLMGNHVHLLIKGDLEDVSQFIKRVATSYAWWFNFKYEHSGHVFQDRFKSECVEDDRYLLAVIRYIHQNPVKAGLEKKPDQYKWSSCRVYYGGKEYPPGLTDLDFILNLFGDNKTISMEKLQEFMEKENNDQCLEDQEKIRLKDKDLHAEIIKLLHGRPVSALKQMNKTERDLILQKVKELKGSNIRQISRITGIGFNIVYRA
jgi:REP element-mobilizing transposase RayT